MNIKWSLAHFICLQVVKRYSLTFMMSKMTPMAINQVSHYNKQHLSESPIFRPATSCSEQRGYCLVMGVPLRCSSALQRLRGWEDVDSEMEEMRLEEQSEKAEGRLSVLNLCSFPSLRWQLISITVMNMGQQLSGVNAVGREPDPLFLLHFNEHLLLRCVF